MKHLEANELQRQRREKTPFIYCRLVANHPKITFATTLSLHILTFIIAGILFATGYELFPTDFQRLPMSLNSLKYRLRDYSWRDRNTFSQRERRSLTNTGFARYERGLYDSRGTVTLYYDTKEGNIFTATNLRKIQEIERDLESTPGYKSQNCMTHNSSLTCKPVKSIIRYFDGTFQHIDNVFNDPEFENITNVLYAAKNNNITRADFEFFIPKTHVINGAVASGSITRSEILFGCSLDGDSKCNSDIWNNKNRDYVKAEFGDKLEKYIDTDNFDFYYYSVNLWYEDVFTQAIKDMLCAVGSMLAIFILIILHVRSLFIALLALMSIFACFIGTELLYVGVIGFQYFGFFHILSIFIILGIGADNIFVFYDVWRLTAFSSYPSLAHRLSDAYSKSTLSMFITSLTTSVAFFSSAISPLLATRSFGIFSGMLILYNYISVIIYFPTVVVMYHLHFENWHWPCCRHCMKPKDENMKDASVHQNGKEVWSVEGANENMDSKPAVNGFVPNGDSRPVTNGHVSNGIAGKKYHITFEDWKLRLQSEQNGYNHTNSSEVLKTSTKTQKQYTPTQKKHVMRQKKLVIFFRDYYFKFVTHKVIRWLMLPIFIACVATLGYQASKLEPDNEELKIFKDSHKYSKSNTAQLYKFVQSASSNLVTVYVAWGLGLKDKSDCHFSAIECRGKQVYDDNFNLNPEANQLALKAFCDKLYGLSPAQIQEYRIRVNANGRPEIACFTRSLESYLKSLPFDVSQGGALNLSLPWNHNTLRNFMSAQPSIYNVTGFNNSHGSILSVPMQYWMYDGYTDSYTGDYGMYNDLYGEQTTTDSRSVPNHNVHYGNKLMYIGVQINTTINRRITGYSEGIPMIEKWESLVTSMMSDMPEGVDKGYQLTRYIWHWLYVQETLANNAVLGIIIGVSLAFPILTISTMNIVIGFLATLSMCCTTISVIGVIPTAGWKLGLLVSLNMCLVVGLSVDYVVHLAEGYHLSLHKDRLNRTRDMLEEMGMSVFLGACTTLSASLFMFLSQVQFFLQFGIFLFCTIGFSLFFSLGMFTVLMGIIGPQNEVGDLRVLIRWCKRKCSRNSN
ncbi:hypothetical protein FSP39_015842 [Pinctada imbricata]|uniref:SSD domain-containing protein n=1 Tax=Pinctada imbricata TaxID=66713 RepID=A0AA89BZH4_PINIB|nr:hypothetical protein FSP39_015842 [Pinctada imbricata]